jgi:peptidylamidoglycolate lyase
MKLRMKCAGTLFTAVLVIGLIPEVSAAEKGGEDETGPYDIVPNWLKPFANHPGWTFGPIYGVLAESPSRIFVLQGGELPDPRPKDAGRGPNAAHKPQNFVFIVNRNGELIETWAQWDKLFSRAHKVTMNPYDPQKHVWIIDDVGQQIFEFTNDGKELVMTLGEKGVGGSDETHFGRPTDIAFLPDGTFYVSDGYVNTRVVKFDKNGKFLMAWGSKGTGPGEFNLVHCVAIDANRRVYVIDRDNHRVQIFDETGKFLDEWRNLRSPTHIEISQDQFAWVSDSANNRMLKYDLAGKLLTYWGIAGQDAAGLDDPHQFSIDSEGNLYIADAYNYQVKKFTPKPNVDRGRLVGQPFVFVTGHKE